MKDWEHPMCSKCSMPGIAKKASSDKKGTYVVVECIGCKHRWKVYTNKKVK